MDNGASSYRRFLDGDDNAIAEIVGEYKDGLMLFLNGYVKNIFVAEELTEDTFFRLITKKPRYSGKSSFRVWLYTIGRNVTIDHIRRNAKIIDMSFEDIEQCILSEQSLEQIYFKKESYIHLHKTMAELSPDYRSVLWLSFFEGFSNREVAVVMRKSDRQIKNLLFRAKQSLRSKLEKEGFVYEEL